MARTASDNHNAKYPWRSMAVGDWFTFPRARTRNSISGMVSAANQKYGRKRYSVRQMPSGLWRVTREA